MKTVWFDEEAQPDEIGGKAFRLCRLVRAGLPVPRGFCISASGLHGITTADIQPMVFRLGAKAVAVRSSAVEEDDEHASFAGIYVSRLNVSGIGAIVDALVEIRKSTESSAATAYRHRLGITKAAKMAAIVQEFLCPVASGVLFMRDPIGGACRIVVEGSWGLGEAVVGGRVTPDRWVLSLEGDLISTTISDKDVAIVAQQSGTTEVEVESCRRKRPCLAEKSLRELCEMATACEQVLGGPQDIEWATSLDQVWILQSRPITGAVIRGQTYKSPKLHYKFG